MAQSKLEATRIERAVLAACGSGDYRSLDPVSREACVRMFSNKDWELPRDLAGENSRRDELSLWKSIELCLKYPDVRDSSNRERQEYAFARLVEKWGKDFPVKDLWIPQIKEYQIERLHDGAAAFDDKQGEIRSIEDVSSPYRTQAGGDQPRTTRTESVRERKPASSLHKSGGFSADC